MKQATVRAFLAVLDSKITQWDQKETARVRKRGGSPNIYALGLLLGAAGKVKDAFRSKLESSDPKDLESLKAAINRAFNPGFPPAKNTIKQIQAYLDTGKMPSLVRKSAAEMASRVASGYLLKKAEDSNDLPMYGQYVFWLLHARNPREEAKANKLQDELSKLGFKGWGESLQFKPKALATYRALAKRNRIEPQL